MSIERMKRLWAVMEHDRLREFLDFLAGLRAVHLIETAEPGEGAAEPSRPRADSASHDARIGRLSHVLEMMSAFEPPPRTFGETFVGFPLEVSAEELARAVESLDDGALDEEATALYDETASLRHRIEEIRHELGHLATWARLGCAAPETYAHAVAWIGTLTARMDRLLRESGEAAEVLVIHELGRGRDNRVLLQLAALKEDEARARDLLRDFDFAPLPMPPGVSVRDMIGTLHTELAGAEERLEAVAVKMHDLIARRRRDVVAVLGWLEVRRDVARSEEKSVLTKRLVVVTGYVRARDAERIARDAADAFPHVGLRFEDPAADENVPVELRTIRLVKPAQFLVRMFGLPSYRGFDPSPFIMFNFLLFFGFCFGDVIYGIALVLLGLYIASRVRGYPGIHNFFTLLAWGGLSATIVGALTGSWGGDLISAKYLPADSALVWLRDRLCLLDMTEQPVPALVVALGIGVLNQFYGIVMKMYQEFRRNDWKAAVFDAGLWLVTLPGVILLIVPIFAPHAPSWMFAVGAVLAAAGAVGLVLTQGRNEKSFLGKAVVGFVSLYGIFGSYGTTSFVGDTLSYCRLLALGLTTSIVALCFNLIAAMTKDAPVAGWVTWVTFALILVVGHVFNFLISVLGAFVHSARLVFLEFFGRFYEIGGFRFQPLGTSERVRVIDGQS